MKNKIGLLTLSVFLGIPSLCFAQSSGGHGGNVVLCANKPAVVLDYYHAALPTFGNPKPNLVDISAMTDIQVIDFFRGRLQGTALLKKFNDALEILGPIDYWILKDLKDVNDSNEPYTLPNDCSRVQAAKREGDTMYVDPKYGSILSSSQQGMLEVHEALYYVSGQSTSEKVRNLIRSLMILDTPQSEIVDNIRALDTPAYPYEEILPLISGKAYIAGTPKLPGSKSYTLVFTSKMDSKLPELRAQYTPLVTDSYFINTHFDPSQAQVIFKCSTDGITCEIQPGADSTGWQAGCKIVIGYRAFKLTLTCPTQETQSYYQWF